MDTVPPFPCPACGSVFDGHIIAWDVSSRGKAGVQRCPSCGLYITYPRLAEPQGEYMQMTPEQWQAKYGAIDRGEKQHDRHKNYQETTAIIQRYIPRGRIVDVGCNAGWLLSYLQRTGVFEVEGVEPSPVLASIAARRLGVNVFASFLHDVPDRAGYYDGLIATDVIEHILPEEINVFVASVAQVLKPGGYVFMKTPNVRYTALKSRAAGLLPEAGKRLMLRRRDLWDAKEHTIHWDSANMVRLFAAHGMNPIGFVVPLPVETTNSPLGARIGRRTLYAAARTLAALNKDWIISQDLFFIARKSAAH